MTVLIHTRGRPLTAKDAPGSSDKRYSKAFLEAVARLVTSGDGEVDP
jgi:hypothetical protein